MSFDPTQIPDCAVWLQSDSDGNVTDWRSVKTGLESTHFVANKPDDPERGVVIVYHRKLSPEEIAQVEDYIASL